MWDDANFWVLISFSIFVALAFVFAKGKIFEALDQRAAGIREDLERARKLRQEAHALLTEQQHKTDGIAFEVQKIIARGHEQAAALRQSAAGELQNLIQHREEQAADRIRVAEAEAVTAVRNAVVDLTFAASEQLLASYGQADDGPLFDDLSLTDQLGALFTDSSHSADLSLSLSMA